MTSNFNCQYYIFYAFYIHEQVIIFCEIGIEFYFVCTFGELTGTNIETDLTLRKYMYNVLYINHTCNSGSILMVLHYVAYISEEFQIYRIYILSYNHCFVRWYVTLNGHSIYTL